MNARPYLLLLLLIPFTSSLPRKARRAKRFVYEYDGDYSSGGDVMDYEDPGLLPGEVDALRNIMMDLMDILDDGHADEDKSSSSVNGEGEPVVVIVVEDEDQDPNDLTLASLLYSREDPWSRCTRSCTTRRTRTCLYEGLCGTEPLVEEAFCYAPGSNCEKKVNSYLESEGYIIVDYNEDDVEEESEASDDDPDYVPDYEYDAVAEDYDESVLYPDAADNTIGDYYDYGWADYLAGNTGDYDVVALEEEEEEEETPEYYEEAKQEEQEEEEEEEDFEFEGCGKRQIKTTDGYMRILGGRIAQKGSWPWQVAILNRFKETFCGGTLISPQWVLTAAHCLRKRLYVRVGEHDLFSKDKAEVEIRVTKAISYPEYDEETIEHDIALLKLPKEVVYNRHVQPACLPGLKTPPPMKSQCIVSGWGKERETHIFGSDILKYVRVPIVTKAACRDAYPNHPITRNHFCAGFRKGKGDTCSGDSGGPLVCDDFGKWTIHGVTSFGEGCGDRGKFGVYTKVKNYLKWIKTTMRENS